MKQPNTEGEPMQDQELVDVLAQVWQSIVDVGGACNDVEWKTPTECPGWSVQDNVSHLVGIEAMLLGRPVPEHVAPDASHVKNDIGRMNEIWVDWYRARSGPEVLDEFREVTGERLALLRGMSDTDFGGDSWTPVGPGTVRDLLPFRIFDSWAHLQDIRRALDRPGDLDSEAAGLAMGRIVGAMGFVLGKKVKPADGVSVVFDVRGGFGRVFALGVDHGRAHPLDPEPTDPTVRITTDVETFLAVGCGRWNPRRVIDDGRVILVGDETLGRHIVTEMNVLF